MSHFEYIAVMVSIIMGLGVVRLLGSLDQVFSRDRYWPHAVWVVSIFWLHVQNWWAFWDMRDVSFNAFLYFTWIMFASLLYLCTVALTNRASADVAWKDHYYAQRQWFFVIQLLNILAGVSISYIFFGTSFLHPYRALQASFLLLATMALLSDREGLHKVIAVLYFVLTLVGISAFRFLPGLFAVPAQ